MMLCTKYTCMIIVLYLNNTRALTAQLTSNEGSRASRFTHDLADIEVTARPSHTVILRKQNIHVANTIGTQLFKK